MRRDDELGIALDQAVHGREQGQLTRGRQCSLRLVEEVQAVASQPMQDQGQKRLPVRLGVQAAATIRLGIVDGRCRVHRCRQIVEGLGSQEVRIGRRVATLGQSQESEQLRVAGARGEALEFGASIRIQSKRRRDPLEQSGFAGAVLTHKERDGRREGQRGEMANRGHREGKLPGRNLMIRLPSDGLDEDAWNGWGEFGSRLLHSPKSTPARRQHYLGAPGTSATSTRIPWSRSVTATRSLPAGGRRSRMITNRSAERWYPRRIHVPSATAAGGPHTLR